MMKLINKLAGQLQRHPKRILFPDGTDHRVMQAARQFATKRLGAPILIGERQKIKETAFRLDISLDNIRLINPVRSEELETFAEHYFEARKGKGKVPPTPHGREARSRGRRHLRGSTAHERARRHNEVALMTAAWIMAP